MASFGTWVVVLSLVLLAGFMLARMHPVSQPVQHIDITRISLHGNISGRLVDANITFSGNSIKSGVYHEYYNGIRKRCYYIPEMGIWTDGRDECKPIVRLPLTEHEVENSITSGEYAPESKCPSGVVCYVFY